MAAGAGLLWVVWGRAFDLLYQSGKARGGCPPRGVHLDALWRLVYVAPGCPLQEYQGAWLAFLGGTALALGLLVTGGLLLPPPGPKSEAGESGL